MAKVFNEIKPLKLVHNNFNMGYDNKFTCHFGDIIPACVQECLPGDVIKYNLEMVVRTIPALAPLLHRVQVRAEAFFVPNRLVWEDWKDFITGGVDGENESVMPTITNEYHITEEETVSERKYTVWDYLGLPFCPRLSDVVDPSYQVKVCALPFRAYRLIWNEFYRNQNVDDELDITNGDLSILKRRWSPNDYFISALPFVQRGPAPYISLSVAEQEAPVVGSISASLLNSKIVAGDIKGAATVPGASTVGSAVINDDNVLVGALDWRFSGSGAIPEGHPLTIAGRPGTDQYLGQSRFLKDSATIGVGHDLTARFEENTLSFTADDLRRLMAAEQYLERNARSGARYTEQVLSRFGVYTGDYRIQRPEFLGSMKTNLSFAEIPQTSSTTNDSPQGNLSGKGVAGAVEKLARYRCKEHGYFMVLFSIVPYISYASQGIGKKWRRSSKYDYYTPEFSHLSEQKIEKSELYCETQSAKNVETFGYQGIYDEYRYNDSIVTSDFRDNFEYWHLARSFSSHPALNSDFLEIDETRDGLNRVFAVQNVRPFLVDVYNDLIMNRPLPVFAEPGIATF